MINCYEISRLFISDSLKILFFFFFQAEDGIRDYKVTGVQTCALPILVDVGRYPSQQEGLAALVTNPNGMAAWRGPYLKAPQVPLDPWGHTYQYREIGRASCRERV